MAAAPRQAAPQVLALTPVAAPAWLETAYRAGRPFVVTDIDEDLMRAATPGDERQYRALAALGSRSMLAVPLLTAGQLVGLLTVTSGNPRQWSDPELALAGELGQRLAAMVAAERVTTRHRQLHEVTVALAGAGSVAEAAAELTTGLRQILGATVVGVCRLDADGALHLVHEVGYPADRAGRFGDVRLDAPLPFADAARTGRPVWLPTRQAWSERYPASSAQLLEETQASVALPLVAGGRVLGTVAASFPEPRLFEPDERAFLLSLADQAAVAFERARLADVRREMADTLQRSLLPARLPTIDRLALTARYLPAVAGTAAGGDWYDVVPLDGGCVALVVGDVVGHGAAAAAVMGRLSSGLSSPLLAGHRPARALELLDRFATRIDGATLATVACLLLDPSTGHLTYSTAGHPPPLLAMPDGPAAYLDGGHGPALAVRTAPRRNAAAVLPPGATLLLYTDGLIERRDATLDDGLDRLAAATAARSTAPLPELVDAVLADLLDRPAADDVAVLAARRLSD